MKIRTFLSLIALVFAQSAFAGKVRLYDLQTGKMVVLEYKDRWGSGHGQIKGTMPNGQKVTGEFRTTENQLRTNGEQRGSAVLTGEGIVLDCDYIVDGAGWGNHGSGTCRDNSGKRYKLIF